MMSASHLRLKLLVWLDAKNEDDYATRQSEAKKFMDKLISDSG